MNDTTSIKKGCSRSVDTAAYLDGELDTHSALIFEEHLKVCRYCIDELREQRRLLCALDFALRANDSAVDLPVDFAQVVATNAESDMSGLRDRVEHRRAFRVCVGLALAAFVFLGGTTLFSSVSIPIKAVARISVTLLGFFWNALYDAGTGAAVVLRPLGRRLMFESQPLGIIAFLLFAIAIALLPRLIARYHRTHITE